MIEHRSVVNRLNWMQNAYPIDENDVLLQKTPFFMFQYGSYLWGCRVQKMFLNAGRRKLPLAIVERLRSIEDGNAFCSLMLNVFLEYLQVKSPSYRKSVV
jgi:hypothetical protein